MKPAHLAGLFGILLGCLAANSVALDSSTASGAAGHGAQATFSASMGLAGGASHDRVVGHGVKPDFEMPAHMQAVDDSAFKYKPAYITVTGDRELTEADFEDPSVCAGCHPKQYEGWKGSMHSNSFKDPIFQKLWSMAEKATDGALMNHCGGCHTPIGVLTKGIKHDPETDSFTAGPIAEQGVSCDVCHSIKKTNYLETATQEHGNASWEIDPQGPAGTKRGPLKDAVSPYHKTEYSELHTKADFCGNCHNIFHPGNGFPIERTYDEWKYSPYARAGIVCQDCHMNPVEVAVRVAEEMKPPEEIDGLQLGGFAGMGASKEREVVHSHQFVGGNTVVTALLGGSDDSHAAAARERLQNAARVDLQMLPRADGLIDLRVKVTNTSAGHNLPTSLTDVRQIWIEVRVKDDAGNEFYRNGTLDSHGELDEEDTTLFNAVARNEAGEVTHFPWEVSRFSRDTSIPPKGDASARYTFKAPEGSKAVTTEVRLNYRSYSQHLADVVLGEGVVKIPVIEMELETATLNL